MRQFFCLVGAFYMASVSPQASAQPARWETLTDEGVRAHEQGRYVEAGRLLSAALKEAENFKQNDSRVVDSLNNLAELYYTHGKYDQAEPLYKRALSIAEQVLSADDPKLARSLNNLGTLYQTQGKYVEAEPLYRRSLAIWKQALGPQNPSVATSLNNLAEPVQRSGEIR